MKCSNTHVHKDHNHSPDCGHTAIVHSGHIDYLHDGHLHHPHDGHYDEHVIEISDNNPDQCAPIDACNDHVHGVGCGHEMLPHGDHVDYLVNGRLHHIHGGHCDDHGPVEVLTR